MKGKEWLIGVVLALLCLAAIVVLRDDRNGPPPETETAPAPVEAPEAVPEPEPAPVEPPAAAPAPVPAVQSGIAADSPAVEVEAALAPPALLRGTVRDADGPVAGVELELVMHRLSTVSAADGSFRLEGEPRGKDMLQVRADRHLDQRHDVVLRAEETSLDVLLLPGEGSFTGRVVDEQGQGLAGIGLELAVYTSHRDFARTVSDERGGFRFVGIPPAEIGVIEEAHDPAGVYVLTEPSVSFPLAEPAEVRLGRMGELRGTVYDDAGSPVVTRIVARGGPAFATPGTSDAEGAFSMPLAPGDYTVSLKGSGFVAPPPVEIRVPSGETVTLDLTVGRGAELRGTVVDETGTPIEAAAVTLVDASRSSGRMIAEATLRQIVAQDLGDELPALDGVVWTDPTGSFALSGLDEGENQVVALHPDYTTGAAKCTVVGGVSPAPVRIELRAGGRLEGTVYASDGGPLARSALILSGGGAPQRSGMTGEDGSYRFGSLEAGSYTLMVYDLDPSAEQPMAGITSHRVELEAGERRTFDIHLGAGVEVDGRVLRAGQPLAQAEVQLVDPRQGLAGMRMANTDADGRFTTLVHAGRYELFVSLDSQQARFEVEIPRGVESFSLGDIVLSSTRLAGRVLAAGVPLAGAEVFLLREGASPHEGSLESMVEAFAGNARTAEDGSFELIGMGGGSYRLRVQAAGHATWSGPVELLEGGERLGFDVALEPEAALRGVVLDPDGDPVRATLLVRGLDPAAPAPLQALALLEGTAADGSFALGGLSAGAPYTVFAFGEGHGPGKIDARGGDSGLELRLTVPGSARLTVTRGTVPAPGLQLYVRYPWGDAAVGLPDALALSPETDARGRVSVSLAPGSYAFTLCDAEGTVHGSGLLRVRSGETTEQAVDLLE